MKIGIPRALHTYYFFPMWHFYLSELGAEVVLSPPSSQRVLDQGIQLSVADICVPLKLLFGHVASLAGEVDAVFIPRVVSVHKKRFFCPKFIALPDMVKAVFPGLTVMSADLNAKEGWHATRSSFCRLGKCMGVSPRRAGVLFEEAVGKQFQSEKLMCEMDLFHLLEKGNPTWRDFTSENRVSTVPTTQDGQHRSTVALLGYPYIVHDGLASLNVKDWFKRNGVRVVTYEMVPREALEAVDTGLSRDVYWEASRSIIQAAIWCLNRKDIDGVIFVTAFGCGPGSMKKEIIERRARRARGRAFMSLVVDEHTSPGGFITRLEAFADMMEFHQSGFSRQ